METSKESVASVAAKIEKTHYQTIIKIDNHTLIADEPVTIGGMDTGPTPDGLLLASLGSCTAITLRMYINRKMWAVEHITVNLELFRTEGITLIERRLSFDGELSPEQKVRLVKIADACPIHKLLTNQVNIVTDLA